ncbi:hypothetical protein LTR84_013154 [Exophiala bonariae]|uniref:Condensation domain-containing protein n=1 Tax=Exophiala bonariae TaxID=1690606 RepID=A0AAV9NEZ7_9EURO|nr:hypothetical protein LTR84_013154 [Exophiala bonariae]
MLKADSDQDIAVLGDAPMSALSSDSPFSASPASARLSIPSSHTSDEQNGLVDSEPNHNDDFARSGSETLHADSLEGPSVDTCDEGDSETDSHHKIHLSAIEHCMPRSYIRICLAYRMPDPSMLPDIVRRLNNFVRRTVDAKPYLSGYIMPAKSKRVGAVEVRFSDRDFLEYPAVSVRHLTHHEVPFTYDQLDQAGLPPSVMKPDLVSALAESADEEAAPVFRMQANVIDGGIIVSLYLHHCVSDGTGAGLLISGSILTDEGAFDRYLGDREPTSSLSVRLREFANLKSIHRKQLSFSFPNQINNRSLKCKKVKAHPEEPEPIRVQGRGCVVAFSLEKLTELKTLLETQADSSFITQNDALQALLWHSMVKARVPSLENKEAIAISKLLIPINIRGKLENPLPESYFGTAIDFATAQLSIDHLTNTSPPAMIQTAIEIRRAINAVDEPYIRQAIALARYPESTNDVRDLQASNMDRAYGADMYVTSWEKLDCYEATFDLGLGRPDWVRKPWSKDPGSCIVLPFDGRKDYLEVVIQMTVPDMDRLLEDPGFMDYVVRVID